MKIQNGISQEQINEFYRVMNKNNKAFSDALNKTFNSIVKALNNNGRKLIQERVNLMPSEIKKQEIELADEISNKLKELNNLNIYDVDVRFSTFERVNGTELRILTNGDCCITIKARLK